MFACGTIEPWITPDIEGRVWAYLAEVANLHGMVALKIGGLDDHIHAVLELPPTLTTRAFSPDEAVRYRDR